MPAPSGNAPLVSVIMVTYNNADTIESCLDSLRTHLADTFEVVVVDNSSDRTTQERLEAFSQSWPDFPLFVIRPAANIGFGTGCNLCTDKASGDYLLFLNPDTRLENDIVAAFMSHEAKTENTGLAGPKILNSMGGVERTCRNLPTLGRIWLDATGLDRFFGAYRLFRFDHCTPRKVEQLMGACLFVSAGFFRRLGGFDERFFVYFEEVDLCKRGMEQSRDNWFVPDAVITHRAGTSCESVASAARMTVQLRTSRVLYFTKHFGTMGGLGAALVNTMEALAKWPVLTLLSRIGNNPVRAAKARGFKRVALCFGCWH